MKTEIKSGTLLLSQPFMADPNFERTVVLICDHDKEGSLGFVINRPTDVSILEVMPLFTELDSICYEGGPVAKDTLHFLHNYGKLQGCKEVLPGLFWSGNFEQLRQCISRRDVKAEDIQFFIGYSGWDAGQLDDEIEEGSWILTTESKDDIFLGLGDLWKNTLKNMGGQYKLMAGFPKDPRLN